MERRASSIPPNPFWSERTRENFQLEAARPMELPKVPSEGEDTSRHGSVMSVKPVIWLEGEGGQEVKPDMKVEKEGLKRTSIRPHQVKKKVSQVAEASRLRAE